MRRTFVDTMRDVRGGEVLEDLSNKLNELVQAVQTTNAGGEITLKISVKPMKGSTEAVVVTDDIKSKIPEIKSKIPEIKSAGTVMFTTPDGNLQRNHPGQDDLPGITLARVNG